MRKTEERKQFEFWARKTNEERGPDWAARYGFRFDHDETGTATYDSVRTENAWLAWQGRAHSQGNPSGIISIRAGTNEQRAEFEAWVNALSPSDRFELTRHPVTDEYIWWLARGAWLAWQGQEQRHAKTLRIGELFEQLLSKEGDGITIPWKLDQYTIVVFSGAQREVIYGENFLDCLEKAVKAREKR